ncbi:MAG: HAMP domain-containing protein [Synergistaceae bacterium]|jgi:two-component system sensor histidine kinase CpxA|nr:HAMP domain-containing protein [Synergistaceae bacterium]
MKRLVFPSLFWKIYLTLLLVLFLPMIIIHLTHLARVLQDREDREPLKIFKHLEWHVSELARQADSIPREELLPWIEAVRASSDLEIRVERDGESFFTEGAERLDAQAEETPFRFFETFLSPSGRTRVVAALRHQGPANFLDFIKIPMAVAVLSVFFSFMLVKNFMTPLSKLQDITQKLAGGVFSVRVDPSVTGRGDEIAALGKSFNKMAECVENLVSSQKRLLRDISHEIRSPLQRMDLAAALLRKNLQPASELENKYLERIELEVKCIDDMVEELLTLTRVEEGSLTHSERVALDEVLRSAVEDAAFANTSGKTIVILNAPKLAVRGDALLLKRALYNVIQNALRYIDPESVVEIDLRQEDGQKERQEEGNRAKRAVLTVRDHGYGVAEEELEKIFLPYYRTDKARERSQGGVGLGLSITRRIVESHGGNVFAANAPGGGLVVTIALGIDE